MAATVSGKSEKLMIWRGRLVRSDWYLQSRMQADGFMARSDEASGAY